MKFQQCKVKSIKADIANGELTISFGMAIDDDSMETAERLAIYVGKDASKVEVRVVPQQPPLVGMLTTEAEKDDSEMEGESHEDRD
ncbi:hypothetical protein D4S03_05525 [bacterium]|nr:MAG: hypothetical protein D4S03_05525 [bacterium]